jgi:hypothetical protein
MRVNTMAMLTLSHLMRMEGRNMQERMRLAYTVELENVPKFASCEQKIVHFVANVNLSIFL